MKEGKGNILYMPADAVVITTNGFTTSQGKAVMGRGIAKEVSMKVLDLPYVLGALLQSKGNHVFHLKDINRIALISFPVKPDFVINDGSNLVKHAQHLYSMGRKVPGYHAKADLSLIEKSAKQLVELANKKDWKKVLLPRPGCGAGELSWRTVKPILEKELDDRFVVCTF